MARDGDPQGATTRDGHPSLAQRSPFDPVRTPTAATAMSAQLGRVTEVHVVNTAFGPAKLQETSKDKAFLIMRTLPVAEVLVPYVDRGAIAGAYRVDPEHAMVLSPGVVRYPVIEVVPALFLDAASRSRIDSALRGAGLQLRFAEDSDVTDDLRQALTRGELLWKSHAAADFVLELFARELKQVRGSPRFERVYLAELVGGERYLLAVERTLASVIRMHPYFERVDQREAVRLRLATGQDTWVARLP
jgi:hypothetical protein